MADYPELMTYTDEQMDEISFALRHFLDSKVLSKREELVAEDLLDRFSSAKKQHHEGGAGGKSYAYISVSEEAAKLLGDVEAALWAGEH